MTSNIYGCCIFIEQKVVVSMLIVTRMTSCMWVRLSKVAKA